MLSSSLIQLQSSNFHLIRSNSKFGLVFAITLTQWKTPPSAVFIKFSSNGKKFFFVFHSISWVTLCNLRLLPPPSSPSALQFGWVLSTHSQKSFVWAKRSFNERKVNCGIDEKLNKFSIKCFEEEKSKHTQAITIKKHTPIHNDSDSSGVAGRIYNVPLFYCSIMRRNFDNKCV